MKYKTIRMTKMCEFCQTAITYRKEENLRAGELNGHLHAICKKAKAEKESQEFRANSPFVKNRPFFNA